MKENNILSRTEITKLTFEVSNLGKNRHVVRSKIHLLMSTTVFWCIRNLFYAVVFLLDKDLT